MVLYRWHDICLNYSVLGGDQKFVGSLAAFLQKGLARGQHKGMHGRTGGLWVPKGCLNRKWNLGVSKWRISLSGWVWNNDFKFTPIYLPWVPFFPYLQRKAQIHFPFFSSSQFFRMMMLLWWHSWWSWLPLLNAFYIQRYTQGHTLWQ